MTALLLPFAMRMSDGQLVSAEEVPRGAACNCLCPGCRGVLLARQGTEREWHFAHAKAGDCANGYEKSVHELAKQLVRQRKQLLLPVMEAVASAIDVYGRPVIERLLLSDAELVTLDDFRSSQTRNEVTADITGVLEGMETLVEVTVFHRLMPEKLNRLIGTGIPVFQIDLGIFKTEQATKERLERELFQNPDNRKWLWHPRLDKARANVQAKLDEMLKQARRQRDEEQPKRFTAPTQPAETALRTSFSTILADRMWRAALPAQALTAAAAKSLADRIGRDKDSILALTETIKSRGQLRDRTPADLAKQWAQELLTDENEVARFLVEAGYVLM